MNETLAALLGLLIGAIVQYRFSLLQSRKGKFDELRAKAYSDFILAISKISIAQKSKDPKSEAEAFTGLIDAKARICIYGHKRVVTHLAHLWDIGPILDEDPSKVALLKAIQSMREVIDLREEVPSESEIASLLYK